jgi:hypothetical protein
MRQKKPSHGIFDKIIVNVMMSKSKKQLAIEQMDDSISIKTDDFPFESDEEEEDDVDVPFRLCRVYHFS